MPAMCRGGFCSVTLTLPRLYVHAAAAAATVATAQQGWQGARGWQSSVGGASGLEASATVTTAPQDTTCPPWPSSTAPYSSPRVTPSSWVTSTRGMTLVACGGEPLATPPASASDALSARAMSAASLPDAPPSSSTPGTRRGASQGLPALVERTSVGSVTSGAPCGSHFGQLNPGSSPRGRGLATRLAGPVVPGST